AGTPPPAAPPRQTGRGGAAVVGRGGSGIVGFVPGQRRAALDPWLRWTARCQLRVSGGGPQARSRSPGVGPVSAARKESAGSNRSRAEGDKRIGVEQVAGNDRRGGRVGTWK